MASTTRYPFIFAVSLVASAATAVEVESMMLEASVLDVGSSMRFSSTRLEKDLFDAGAEDAALSLVQAGARRSVMARRPPTASMDALSSTMSADPCLDGTVDCGASFMQRRSVLIDARAPRAGHAEAGHASKGSQESVPRTSMAAKVSRDHAIPHEASALEGQEACPISGHGCGVSLVQQGAHMFKARASVNEAHSEDGAVSLEFSSTWLEEDLFDAGAEHAALSLVQAGARRSVMARRPPTASMDALSSTMPADPCLDGTVDCGASFMQRRSVLIDARAPRAGHAEAGDVSKGSQESVPRLSMSSKVVARLTTSPSDQEL